MPTAERSAPPVVLIVRWPQRIAASAGPEQLARLLAERRLHAAWSIEAPSQAVPLRTAAGKLAPIETSLLIGQVEGAPIDAIANGLRKFHGAGLDVSAIQLGANVQRENVERTLCQLGVRAIVVEGAPRGWAAVRPVPFGLWQLAPQAVAPSKRRWLRRTDGVPRGYFENLGSAPGVVCFDMERIASTNSRGWREIEQAIREAAAAIQRGSARMAAIGDLSAELSQASVPKPQRSILRAA